MEQTVAQLVDELFKTKRRPDGREYTYQEVAAATNGQLSPAYLSKLRTGDIKNPGRYALILLCSFFKVPASYFFPELDNLEAEQPSEDERIEIALRSSSLPEDVQRHLQGLIKAFRQRENED